MVSYSNPPRLEPPSLPTWADLTKLGQTHPLVDRLAYLCLIITSGLGLPWLQCLRISADLGQPHLSMATVYVRPGTTRRAPGGTQNE